MHDEWNGPLQRIYHCGITKPVTMEISTVSKIAMKVDSLKPHVMVDSVVIYDQSSSSATHNSIHL